MHMYSVVVDSVVRYVTHYDDGSLASIMDSLVDCIVSSIDGIDNLIVSLLSSLTQDTVHKVCMYVCMFNPFITVCTCMSGFSPV